MSYTELAILVVGLPLGMPLGVLLVDGAESLRGWVRYRLYLRRLWKEHHRIYGGKS